MRNGKYITFIEQQNCSQKEDRGCQATDSDKGSLGDEKVDETKERVHRHTRRQVQFREGAQNIDKVSPKMSDSV